MTKDNPILRPRVWSEQLPETDRHCTGTGCPFIALPGLDKCPRCVDTGEVMAGYISLHSVHEWTLSLMQDKDKLNEQYRGRIRQLEGSAFAQTAWRWFEVGIGLLLLAEIVHRLGGS